MIIVLFSAFLVLHGLIHLMGFAKAFGYAELPALTQPVSRPMAMVWLLAAALMVAAAGAIWAWPRGWWIIGATAVVVSQIAITGSWVDAKFGTIANILVMTGVAFGWLAFGPTSLRAQYESDVALGVARLQADRIVTDADLAHLPAAVQRYLRTAGVVGRPHVQNVRVRMHGRIRSNAGDSWMPVRAEQFNFYDHHSRFFYLNASRMLIPVQGLHRFADGRATMLVKLAAVVPVAEAQGAEATRAETVTLFNDMCLFAPATLVDPSIAWTPVDTRSVRATFAHAGHTISADLIFNDAGELVDFVSDDRGQAVDGGTTMRRIRWSTPVGDYREFNGVRLISRGEGLWHESTGAYAYIELTIDDVAYNVAGG